VAVLAAFMAAPAAWGAHGGVLNVRDAVDFESLDPGEAFYSLDYEIVYATQRPLYSALPGASQPSADLAAGPPRISADRRTVAVTLKRGIRFSPPVNREVTSADVAYAIERGANPNVGNPYFLVYFASIEGMPTASGGPIKGIHTPSRHEIVFKLSEPQGAIVAQALQLPLTAPVPESYARRFDAHRPSDYAAHEVATGPYMLAHNAAGTVLGVGYVPGASATLVRNPNWRRSRDFRPAHLNAIHIAIGGSAAGVGRSVLAGGDVVENDPPAASVVQLAASKYPAQLHHSVGAGDHYVALDNRVGPFANVDLRKAVWAALDRVAMVSVRGVDSGEVASHFLYPTIPGFEQAGGAGGPKGAQFDFDEHPEGNMAIAEKYLRLAGYPSGRYTATKPVTIVGTIGDPGELDAEIVDLTLLKLGFVTKFTLVTTAQMYGEYCGVPKQAIDVCPDVGWISDFGDPQATLDSPFNGRLSAQPPTSNWSQTNDPSIDAAMTAAEPLIGGAARAAAWARIDEQLVEDAAAVPYVWDAGAAIEGRRVAGVADVWNIGAWDYSFTSLK